MGEEDVLVEVVINGRHVLQFYSTQEHYQTLYDDREALITTVKTAFTDGVLAIEYIKDVDDIQSVQFLSEVATGTSEFITEEGAEEQEYEEYEIVEETEIDNITSSELPEELIVDVGLSAADERLNLCAYCDYRTYNIGHFNIHMRQHTGENPFQCSLCDYKSKQKSNLKRHMRQHQEGKDHFECKLCNFTCTQEKVYKRHLILHSRSRPLRPCPFCDYFSTSLAHLTVHIRQHTGETPYHCGLCSYKTVQKSNLTRHLKKHRKGRISKADKLRCCLHCPYRTPNPAHLVAHVRAAHTGETPYACSECDYKSAQRSNLKRHLRKHTGERPYVCEICNYTTAYPYVLKKHIENHPSVDEELRCEICDFLTRSQVEYRRHLKLHMGKPVHCCHVCGYISLNADHLKTHLRRHSLEKPFKCHYCKYVASQKSNLKRHVFNKHFGHLKNVDPNNLNSEEGVLENRQTEILNIDSSNSGILPEERNDLENSGVAEGIKTENHEPTSNAANEEVGEQTHEENENEGEAVEVVSEEQVITTAMEEGEYDMLEEEYIDGTLINGATVECTTGEVIVERSRKSKNLSFLNKSQAEKLKEFKRLLQQGTQYQQNGPVTSKFHEEASRQTMSADYDNISENTESCNEDPGPDEDFQDSAVSQENERSYQSTTPLDDRPMPESDTLSSEMQHVGELMSEDASILIVERAEEEEDTNHYKETESDLGAEEVEVGVVHTCELCGFEAPSLEDLKAHIGIHTGESLPTTYHCDLCNFRTLRKADIARHKTLFHGASPPRVLSFVCNVCGYRTGSKEEYMEHDKSHKVEPVKCKICELKCSNLEELKVHSRNHIGEEPFECYYCAYLTARKCHLRKHMRRHSIGTGGKGPPYQCYTCGYHTDTRENFHKHIGKHKIEQRKPHTCPDCRFVTLDEKVFENHLKMHSGAAVDDKTRSSEVSSKRKEQSQVPPGMRTHGDIKKQRVPLKEWFVNASDPDESLGLSRVKNEFFGLGEKKKKNSKEDYYSLPVKKRRKGLKSLKNAGTSLLEARLSRKFNFNIHNLSGSKEIVSGLQVELTGEVLKSHGSLRKYSNYGDVLNKNDNEKGIIMSNIDNEKQLRTVYEQLKQSLISFKSCNKEQMSSKQFTIFFKEIDENPTDLIDDSLSDIDLSISSGNDSELDNLIDLDSDLDLELNRTLDQDVSSSVDHKSDLHKRLSLEKSRKNSSNNPESEFTYNLDEADKVKFLQEKIRQRNERMKELRRLKILNVSGRNVKKEEVNGFRSLNEPIINQTVPVPVVSLEDRNS